MNYKVYLAGPITNVDLGEATDWRAKAKAQLALSGIDAYSPLRYKEGLLPPQGLIGCDVDLYDCHPLTSARGITARDRYDVKSADLMIANLLDMTISSIGTAIEFGQADIIGTPVILIIEPSGSIMDHPILDTIAGFRVETVEAACALAAQILLP